MIWGRSEKLMCAGFGNDYDFLPTIEEEEEDLLLDWENSKDRKKFERELEAEDPESFKHCRNNVLVNHPEYVPDE